MEGASSVDLLEGTSKNVLPQIEETEYKAYDNDEFLEIGTIKMRLHIPGLFDVMIPVPRDTSISLKKWDKQFYGQFRYKFWDKAVAGSYKCLICNREFLCREGLINHFNRHMGFHIARCTKCDRGFYSLMLARKHAKICCIPPKQI